MMTLAIHSVLWLVDDAQGYYPLEKGFGLC